MSYETAMAETYGRWAARPLPKLSSWSTFHGGGRSVTTRFGKFVLEPTKERATHWDRFPRGNRWRLRFENTESASPNPGLHQDLGTFASPNAAYREAKRFYGRLHVSSRRDPSRRSHRPHANTIMEMSAMLERAGFENPRMWARKFHREGMGPHELAHRIRGGALSFNYRIRRKGRDARRRLRSRRRR